MRTGTRSRATRRRRPMTIAAELLWQLAPPLVFATERLVVAGMLEPCYDNGGDALDYAVNDGVLHVGVFDAMGHGLAAAGVAAFALSAYRHSRRRGYGLLETYAAMDEAVGEQFPDERYVTAVIAQLDLEGRAPVVDQRRASAAAGHSRRAAVAHADRATGRAAGHPAGGAVTGRGRRVVGARRPAAALHRWIDRGAAPRRAAVHRSGARRVHRARSRRGADRSRDAAPAAPRHRRPAARASSGTTPPRCSSSGAAGPKPTCCHRRRPSVMARDSFAHATASPGARRRGAPSGVSPIATRHPGWRRTVPAWPRPVQGRR